VLVIDSEDAVRAALAGWLLQQGFLVWSAANQDEALSVYREHRQSIALVVEDLQTYWLPPRHQPEPPGGMK
jgi:CheY-like chemotaxis protein